MTSGPGVEASHLRSIADQDGDDEDLGGANVSDDVLNLRKRKARKRAINVHVEPEVHQAYLALCKKYDLPKGDVINLALKRFLIAEGFLREDKDD